MTERTVDMFANNVTQKNLCLWYTDWCLSTEVSVPVSDTAETRFTVSVWVSFSVKFGGENFGYDRN